MLDKNLMWVDNSGAETIIQLTRQNFTPNLSVWFDETESLDTEYRSTQTIVVEIPQFSSVMPNMSWIQRSISTSISFVRRVGVIYLTLLVFPYTPQPAAIRKISRTNDIISPTADSDFCE